ncbi:MAG: alpha/beta hydrolase family protein [Acidimicrobiales bacterium]
MLADDQRFDVRHLDIIGVDGSPVEGWFLGPAGADGPVPTLLSCHGGPHAAWGHVFSFDNWMFAAAGYGTLLVNQRGSTGYSQAFAECVHGDFGNLDFFDVMAGVDLAVRLGLADPDRLGVWGISAGAFLTTWAITHSDRFRAAVVESPLLDWSAMLGADVGMGVSPMGGRDTWARDRVLPAVRGALADNLRRQCTTPLLIIQHEMDLRTPPANADQMYALLKLHGQTVEMLRMPRTPHAGSIELGDPATRLAQNEALIEWMGKFVIGDRAPAGAES